MSILGSVQWLLLLLLLFAMLALVLTCLAYCNNTSQGSFFNAGQSLPPWMTALVMAGVAVSGWIVLGFPQAIADQGFGFSVLALAGIVISITGVIFFKPQWAIAYRHHFTSQGKMLNDYYGGYALGVFCTLISMLIAVGFTGIQLHTLAQIFTHISGNTELFNLYLWGISALVGFYLIIGGMRAVGYIGVLQSALIVLAITTLGIWVLIFYGGLSPIGERLANLAKNPEIINQGIFQIAGVIQFTAGHGIDTPVGGQWTTAMVFSSALALMGLQASPMITQLVLSTRSPKGLAAGQTWVLAGFFGLLIVFFIVLIGAVGIGQQGSVLVQIFGEIATHSPWFMAIIALGLLASVQLIMGLSVINAAHIVIDDVYKPYFHKGIDSRHQLTYTRIVIVLILLIGTLLALLTPITLSALSAIALPSALQLWPALLGLCWFRFITRQAVLAGMIFGLMAVITTDTVGISILSFLGLDLPWGRWPWTIHSAGWGIFFNMLSVIVISVITQGRGHGSNAYNIHNFVRIYMKPRYNSWTLRPVAWSAVLAWVFFAIGPGAVLGNFAFGKHTDGYNAWIFGLPSVWAWTILFWVLGVFLIWFLAYKMELTSNTNHKIVALESPYHIPPRNKTMQQDEILRFAWFITASASIITITVWIFG